MGERYYYVEGELDHEEVMAKVLKSLDGIGSLMFDFER